MDNLPRKRRADFQLSPYVENTNIQQTDTSINNTTNTNQETQRKRARARPLNEPKDIPTLKGIFKNISIPSEIKVEEDCKKSMKDGTHDNTKENRIAGLNKSFSRTLEYVINVESSKNLIFLFEQYKKYLSEIENQFFSDQKEKPFSCDLRLSESKDEKKYFFPNNKETDTFQPKDTVNPFSSIMPPSVDKSDKKDGLKDTVNPFSSIMPPSVDKSDKKDGLKDTVNPFFNLLNSNSPCKDLSILKEPEDSSKSSFCDQNIFQSDCKKIDSNNFQTLLFSPGLNRKAENKNLNSENFTENISKPDKKRVSFDLSRNEELNNSTFQDSSFMKSDDSFSLTTSPQNNIFISSSPKTVPQPFTFYEKHNIKDILASSPKNTQNTTPNTFILYEKHGTKDIPTTQNTTSNTFTCYDKHSSSSIFTNTTNTPDSSLQNTNEYLLNNKLQSQNISIYHLKNTQNTNEYILLGKPHIYLKNNFLTIFYTQNEESKQLFKNIEIQNISVEYTNGNQYIVIGTDNSKSLYKILFDNFKDISIVLENLNKK